MLSEKSYFAGSCIVAEDDLVDSIYFIADGEAEVRHQSIPIATLHKGETIGLSETGFYSATGKRTATVVAVTNIIALRLDIHAFHQLTGKNTHLDSLMHEQLGTLQRMNLIKHAAPFAKFSIENLNWIAEQTVEISVMAGYKIFQKDDPGNYCYLIQSGKIEIFIPNPDGEEVRLAILKPNMIFGEMSLLLNTRRNASARALSDCKLLAISRDTLIQATQRATPVAAALMAMTKARCRPLRYANIEVFPYESADDQSSATLKNTVNHTYFRLSAEGLFLWARLDGTRTIRDLAIEYYNEYGVFDPAMISGFIMDLDEAKFIEPAPAIIRENKNLPVWILSFIVLRRIMEANFTFNNTDAWVTRQYYLWAHLFFKPLSQVLLAGLALGGLIVFLVLFHHHLALMQATPHSGWIFLAAISISMAAAILHELAHAFTTKFYKREIKNFGIGWFWLGPVAFCDTSDMWLNPKNQRIHVDLAGMYCDIILAGLASLCALAATNSYIEIFLWLFALFNYISVMRNLNPIIELDGYYTLMDWSGRDNLRLDAVTFIADNYVYLLKNPRLFLSKIEAMYWWACIAYLIIEVIISYFLAKYLLYGLFGISNPYINFILLITVLILSSLSLIAETRKIRH
ncbi:cyclic nucleotide-binding domain-containing protein [Aquicella siphonis]|nr:cyclic nucleotide-binding domain-containing protein [Aquicella siphonis]